MAETTICPYCRDVLGEAEAITTCPSCQTAHHEECWQENQGCTLYGCEAAPVHEPRETSEIPTGWWGRDEKSCPQCHNPVRIEAIRCRGCGAVFEKEPEDATSFQARRRIQASSPSIRRWAIILATLCILPCTAPLAVVVTGSWSWGNRELLRAQPPIYRVLCHIGLVVGLLQIIAFVIAGTLYDLM